MGRKSSRLHYRDESDPLLGFYSQTLQQAAATSSDKSYYNKYNPLYSSERAVVTTSSSSSSSPTAPDSSPVQTSSKLGTTASSPLLNSNSNSRCVTFSADTTTGGGNITGVSSSSSPLLRNYSIRDGAGEGVALQKPTPTSKNNKTTTRRRKKNGYRIHRVSYTAQNHVQVLFQMYGSAFPNVLPFAVINMIWTCGVEYMHRAGIVDLTFHSSIGHSFMGLLVSFLIVSRSKISYDRFMEFRRHLATTYRTCREIAQATTIYTFATQTPAARAWRQEVCFRTIVLLRVTMDALLWSSTDREHWEEEYFSLQEIERDESCENKMKKHDNDNGGDDDEEAQTRRRPKKARASAVSEHFFRFRKLSHGRRSRIDENFRAPITLGHVLKQTIMEHPTALGHKMEVNEYRDIVNFVTVFLDAFHGFRVLIFTPYPFPLVQMTRAFLFFWVYTLPLFLLKDYRLWSANVIVCLTTFGFIGIEYVSMALDDPFGDDTNDVDEHGMALLVYEDIYLAIYRTDGPAAAFELRDRVLAQYKQGRGLDCYRDDLKGNTSSIWEPPHLQAAAAQAAAAAAVQLVQRKSTKNRKLDTINNPLDP